MRKLIRFAISTVVFFVIYLSIDIFMFDRAGGIPQSLTTASIASGVYFVCILLLDAMFARKVQKKPPSHNPKRRGD